MPKQPNSEYDWIGSGGRGRVGAGGNGRERGKLSEHRVKVWVTGLLSFSGQTWVDGQVYRASPRPVHIE
jgi:hypothetical protein